MNVQYSRFVKPSFEDFVLPTKKYADIIIPGGGDNDVAIDLIVQNIRTKLGQHDMCKIYPNIFVIFSTFQVKFLKVIFYLVPDKNVYIYEFKLFSLFCIHRLRECILSSVMVELQNMTLSFTQIVL